MKIGYQYAIKLLLEHYRELKARGGDIGQIQELREGIEYLCYPWREDISETVVSPLKELGDPDFLDDDEELARRGDIYVNMSEYAWLVLKEIGRNIHPAVRKSKEQEVLMPPKNLPRTYKGYDTGDLLQTLDEINSPGGTRASIEKIIIMGEMLEEYKLGAVFQEEALK